MHSFIIMLVACSVTMSVIALLYMAVNPLLAKRYSEKGRYYVWLIILAGFMIPFRPQWGNALIRVDVPNGAAQPTFQIGNGQTILSNIYLTSAAETASIATAAQNISFAWWQIAFVVWLAGLVAFLGFHAVNHLYFMKRVKRWSREFPNEKPKALLQSLKAEMGIKRDIRLVLCEGIGSPVMLGFISPRILLHSADLAEDELRFILQHELVHYKRKDLLYKCLVLVATAIHWFNPVIYLVAKAINTGCELSCDAEIVQSADDDTRRQYSETIIGVVRYQSRFKTALSTTFYGGKKGMENRIMSIMTKGKEKMTFGSMALALVLVFILTAGTLTAFASEPVQYDPYELVGRTLQNIGRRTNGVFVPNPEWAEMFANAEIRFYELDQITPFDFFRPIYERIDGETIYATGRLAELSREVRPISAIELGERLGVPGLRIGMTLEELQELFDVQVTFHTNEYIIQLMSYVWNLCSYEIMRERGKTPIIGANGTILMWVDQSFFDMTYEEFNELAEQLLTTAVIIHTQETVDVLREHWAAAQ